MDLDYKAIGKRIKIARINADISQERLAAAADLSLSHMSNIETGTTKPSLTALVNIANALSVMTSCVIILSMPVPNLNVTSSRYLIPAMIMKFG